MITERELTQIREDAVTLLGSRCSVVRYERIPDGGGGFVDDWVVYIEQVPCRLAFTTDSPVATIGSALNERVPHMVSLPAGTRVTTRDRLLIDGRLWEVVSAPERSASETYVKRCEVMEVPSGGS